MYGPRRVGKTTMANAFLHTMVGKKIRYEIGDDIELQQLLGSQKRTDILEHISPYDIVVIDEAQQIPHIGIAAKMMIDAHSEKTIILTGSSSFDLSQQVGEPLTGRHYTLTLLPLAQSEIEGNVFDKKRSLEDILIFGAYPEVLLANDREEKIKILRELVASYLFKDILALDRLRSPELLLNITKYLALQVGNEVSYNEIAKIVGSDVKTVQRYTDVLEKAFVIKKVRAYSTNPRVEISKNFKYFFYDNGVRNAVVGQFNTLDNRNDVGALWENFVFMELIKKSNLEDTGESFYFWRTKNQREVDIVKESGTTLTAYECKFSESSSAKHFAAFSAAYPHAQTAIIHRENFLNYMT